MRIAIEATCLASSRPTGIPRYARSLSLALAELSGTDAIDAQLTLVYKASRLPRRWRLPNHPRLRKQFWLGPAWPPARDYEIVHTPQRYFPPWPGPRRIATIHDLYALIGLNFPDPAKRDKQIRVYHDLAQQSDHLLFVSESTRRDFQRLVGGDAERMHVVPLGVGPEFRPHDGAEQAALRTKYGLAQPYLLFLGWQQPNKNLPRLLEAFAQSRLRDDFLLVLAGRSSGDSDTALDQQIATLGLTGRIVSLGYFPEADVPPLYAAAAALMFPSLYEGFGLPILEAMASGVPVLTSTVSSCPEVANGHAVLVDPQSVTEIARGMERAVDLEAAARDRARAYAQSMTWEKTARETFAVYRHAASTPARPGRR